MHDGRYEIRAATPADVAALEGLIQASARALGHGFYTTAETEAAIAHVFGVDSELIADGSYFIAVDADGVALGCGGWSRRPTLFGGDRFAERQSGVLDPECDPARIRAFFVAPQAARGGIGARLLETCEQHASAAGFRRLSLMATLPGLPFYARRGFIAGEPILHPCGNILVRFVPMTKHLLLQK